MLPEYQYMGYRYTPWEDKDIDVIKICHYIKMPEHLGGKEMHGPWSPYMTPTLEQFQEFILEWEYGKVN
tara:strand:- start:677 stop:883 length:207 start_codon:yes stop_codon:yes gene_type:complete